MRLFRWILFSAAALVAVVVCSLAVRSWLQPSAEQAARGIVPPALDSPAVRPEYVTKDRAPCRDRNPLRNAYFGALHIHTNLSFDSWVFENPNGPDDAYAFTREGRTLRLPPLDANGVGTREATIDRPLDFAAVTDHAEMLGEVALCTRPDSPMYEHDICARYRGESILDWLISGPAKYLARIFSIIPTDVDSPRSPELCAKDGRLCLSQAKGPWEETQRAAEKWYDRSPECAFTTFVGYEYSLVTPEFNNLHRNVIFRSGTVPPLPISAREAPRPSDLWSALKQTCTDGDPDCDVLAIPHNSNWSGGRMFDTEYDGATSVAEQAALARLRADLEPVVELFQVKGDSECRNGLYGVLGGPDELCDFEKLRRVDQPQETCEGGYGVGGMRLDGCVARLSYTRYALVEGLREEQRLGKNPFQFGLIAGTDTHNGTGGAVEESLYQGATGMFDADPEVRLRESISVPGGGRATGSPLWNNPGGLAGIWAEENTREALFDALKRREVFGTSGPRIRPRLFASWGFDADLCTAEDQVERAYAKGVAMGSDLPSRPRSATEPEFFVTALADPQGGTLERIQIVKAWPGEGNAMHQAVYDVAGLAAPTAALDPETCEIRGAAPTKLCAKWSDPDFDPRVDAVYYARILENPSCRWSTYLCNRLGGEARPEACDNLPAPRVLQERAWTSPVWYHATQQAP